MKVIGSKPIFKRFIRCHICNYEWQTKSDKLHITCPNCTRKTDGNKRRKK